MRFFEIKTIKPLTPEQNRIDSLKKQKERASSALNTEKDRQKKQSAMNQMQKAQQTLANLGK